MLDRNNFIEVFNTHHKEIYNYILSRLGYNRSLSEDITQEVFLKAWKYRERYNQKRSNIRTWLFSITKNTLIDEYRKIGRSVDTANLEDYIETVSKENNAYEKEVYFDVITNLNKLKENEKELIELKYIYGFSMKEIAKVIGKSETATKVKIHRIIKKLRKLLNGN